MAKRSSSGFTYKRRDASSVTKRKVQSGSSREGYLKQDIPIWSPKKGLNRVRILPPTWKGAEHYGLDVWVHYGVGMDNNTFVCLAKNPDLQDTELCPCCEARQHFQADGNDEAADILQPRKRVLCYILDRQEEEKGVQLWPMAYTIDRDIALQSNDDETNEVLFVDDPENGWDIQFSRDGEGQTTKYNAIKLFGKSGKPISRDVELQDEILEFIQENQLPDQIVIAEASHMEEVLEGGVSTGDRDKKKGDRLKSKGRRGTRDEDDEDDNIDERPRSRGTSRRARDEEEDDEDDARPARRSNARRSGDDGDDDDTPRRRRRVLDDEDEEETAVRGKARRRPAAEDDDDDDDAQPKSRRRAARDQEDEDDDDAPPKRRARKPADDDDDDSEAPPKRRRAAAAEDDDDDDGGSKGGRPKLKTEARSKLGRLRR